jgi:hypothetical protein
MIQLNELNSHLNADHYHSTHCHKVTYRIRMIYPPNDDPTNQRTRFAAALRYFYEGVSEADAAQAFLTACADALIESSEAGQGLTLPVTFCGCGKQSQPLTRYEARANANAYAAACKASCALEDLIDELDEGHPFESEIRDFINMLDQILG